MASYGDVTPPQREDKGHDRQLEAHDHRLDNLETLVQTLTLSLAELQTKSKERRTIDVSTQLFFPPLLITKMLGTAIVVAFILGAGQWFTTTYSMSGVKDTMSGVKDTLAEIKSDNRDATTRSELVNKEIRMEQAKQSERLADQAKEIQALRERSHR